MQISPIHQFAFDELPVSVYASNEALGQAAAALAADVIRRAVAERGAANLVFATGNSQLTFLHALRDTPDLPWPAVNAFTMDEYVNLAPDHPARLSAVLRRHLLDAVPVGSFYPVPGRAADLDLAGRGFELLLRAHPADLCVAGIGENGHLAFNDPPVADFADPVWVKVVELEEACRRQQVGEGQFQSLEEMPKRAMTVTIPGLRSARHLLCLVPERRKAAAVRRTLLGPVSTACPASILRQTPHARLFLDPDSAAGIL